MPAVNFGELAGTGSPPPAPKPTAPFRVAVLGDFSGRPAADRPAGLDGLKAVPLDPDDLDTTLGAVGPTATLEGLDGGDVTLSFAALDDFDPDNLYRAIDRFSDLGDEDEKSAYMRSVLRHPAFQRLEAAWRGVDWLARRARKGDRRADFVLYDISLDELLAAVNADDTLTNTPLYQLLVAKAVHGPKGQPWAAVVGLYPFEITAEHAQALGRVGKILTEGGGPFLAGLAPEYADPKRKVPEDDADAWGELRKLPEAGMVGLTAPRFLLRRPYGENTRSIESFAFEEFRNPDDAAGYLWADPGLAAAAVLAQGYLKDGWGFRPNGTLDGLPAHAYRDADDDDHLTVVDRWLDRKAADRLTGFGVMTLQPVRDRDAAQLTRVHAVAGDENGVPAELFGRWGKGGSAGPPRGRFGVGVVTQAGAVGAAADAGASSDFAAATSSSDGGGSDSPPPSDPPAAGSDPELEAMLAAATSDSPPPDDPPPAEGGGSDTSLDDLLKQLDSM